MSDAGNGASPHETSVSVSQQLRDLRADRGISIRQLAREAEISVGYISEIERGVATPSIRALTNICQALKVPISAFFPETPAEPQENPAIVRRKGACKRLVFGESACMKDLVSPEALRTLELIMVRLGPGGNSGEGVYSHSGEEGGIVISGVLDLWVAGEHHRLEAGDSFGFRSSLPHRFANPGAVETVVVWVNTPPFYDGKL